jgi:hypothetical protein
MNFLNFKAPKDFFFSFSYSLEKDLVFFTFQILKDFFIKDFFVFNFFFYCFFIFLIFFFTVFFLLFLGILKNYKRYLYNLVYMIFYFFYIVSKKLEPFRRSLKKKLIHNFLTIERLYFFPFERKVRNFFQNLKNKYEFFFKTPIVKAIHKCANKAEENFGLHNYKFAQSWSKELQYKNLKTIL